MYNFSNEKIPVFFPVLEGAQLQPWFATTTLDQGLELIRNKTIKDFHSIRNVTGALIDHGATVTLQFEKSTKLHQGFIIRNRHCGLCRLKPHDQGCKHLAAIAILSLHAQTGQRKAIPIPLTFVESDWRKIGFFLYEWLSRTKYVLHQNVDNGFSQWEIAPDDGLVRVNIPASWVDQGEQLLQSKSRTKSMEEADTGFLQLVSQLEVWAKTDSERQLEGAGSRSIGWLKDTSIWTWLARMLFTFHSDRPPEFHRDPGSSGFLLQIGDDKKPGALTIFLPKAKTMEMVSQRQFFLKRSQDLSGGQGMLPGLF